MAISAADLRPFREAEAPAPVARQTIPKGALSEHQAKVVLRAAGVPNGYEKLKDFSRGQGIDAARYREFVATLPIPEADKNRLAAMRPADYVGLAASLALQA